MNVELMRFIRKTHDLSIREFAKKIDVSFSLVSRIEGGDRRLTKRVEQRIISAFELTEEKLLTIRVLITVVKN
ncbi:helix-turn-helix domain-containing protein [Bacillus sp. ISL-57]|uniref:helix-turn-helix domain-containing protein n=1 Tax=Bacillus sp. ISL-57 TaxID=2819135 RepID=UPI001BE7D78E|nr:helix-turn-helix transcriptional regulator [Bacillus sp. ISL-57]MBT2714720.1 helix-turn-helix transcriptional regulator [Bacillus sp. ISL-57]